MNRVRKIWAFLLCLCMTAMFMPMVAFAAESTQILVNGTDILKAPNSTVACGEGVAKYDSATNTLTLDHAVIDAAFAVDDNTQGAIMFNNDLNIVLTGENVITSTSCGIISATEGTLTIKGDGRLTIKSFYYGIRKFEYGNITIDGAGLDIDVSGRSPFMGTGIQAAGFLTIKNGADVDAAGVTNDTIGLIGNGGVSISDSRVKATILAKDGYNNAIISDGDMSISNSQVKASSSSIKRDAAIWVAGTLAITDHSNVEVPDASANAVCTAKGDIIISDSTFKGTSSYPALYANRDLVITNSTIDAVSTENWGMWAVRDLLIKGNSAVTALGAITALGGGNSFTLLPPDGELVGVWGGESKSEASERKDSPLPGETNLSKFSEKYFHSELHTHVYGQEVVSEPYKVHDATCTEPATYYKSCVCGQAGTETFTTGEAAGHRYTDTYQSNAEGHWRACACGETSDIAAHTFGDWTVTKAATATTAGSRERICTVCGYKEAEAIAATGTNIPQTGDSGSLVLCLALMPLAGAALTGTHLYSRKRRLKK